MNSQPQPQQQQHHQQQQINCSYTTTTNQQQYASANLPNSSIYQLDTSKHTITMSSNSSNIVNQIKLTNNNQFIQATSNNNQLIQNNDSYSQQIVSQQQQQQQQQAITINNNSPSFNNNLNTKTNLIVATNQNSMPTSANYQFQKLSSLTKESTQQSASTSNLIVQNSTIVNSTTTTPPSTFSPILSHKSSDSFLNLPSPIEQNKTKHLINPFSGELEPMNTSEDEDETDTTTTNLSTATNSSSSTSLTTTSTSSTTTSNAISTTNLTNSNFKNSNVNITLSSSSNSNYHENTNLIKDSNHLCDTDSGIGSKSTTNNAPSQSSIELISPIDLLNQSGHHHKLNESTLLDNQSSLVNFNNESMITESSTILKNKLINDMLDTPNQDIFMNNLVKTAATSLSTTAKAPTLNDLESINQQQVCILNNSLDKSKSAIETGSNDQIDEYFNTADLTDFHQFVTDSNGNFYF